MRKLSTAQARFLLKLARFGTARPPWGFSAAGRAASAWHRTAESLIARGLVTYTAEAREGFRNGFETKLTEAGELAAMPFLAARAAALESKQAAADRDMMRQRTETK
jgi:hypothetical protein